MIDPLVAPAVSKGSLAVLCEDVFAAALPLGEARLVYADPPYFEQDEHGYGVWPGTDRLVERMLELGADDAAFVLHCGTYKLAEVLEAVERLAPSRPRYYAGQPKWRLLAWTKPWRRGGRYPNVAFVAMWEPVVLWYGSRYRNPRGLTEADWICALRDERSLNGHATQKPDEVLFWLFERLLAGAEGRLAVDLFAGTGGAAIMAARMGCEVVAVETDPLFAGKIAENALLPPPEIPGYMPVVAVNPHGRPEWSTLGRVEVARPSLDEDLAARARQRKQAPVTLAGPDVEAGLVEGAPVGEVEAEAFAAPDRAHRGHRAHVSIVAAAGDD